MNHRGVHQWIVPATVTAAVLAALLAGCSSSQLDDNLGVTTLTAKYVDPGATPSPCDDRAPIVDGIGTDEEWSSAEPVFVRLTGENGSGGQQLMAEVRALWVNDARHGAQFRDRLFLLIRYQDDDINDMADGLVYSSVGPNGDLVPSPPPQGATEELQSPARWTRVNAGGVEDQISVAIAEAPAEGSPGQDMIAVNRKVLSVIGPRFTEGTRIAAASEVDFWIWRASRTNLHPVPQIANWAGYNRGQAAYWGGEVDAPEPTYTVFPWTTGFFEDLWIDAQGNLKQDEGFQPFVSNFDFRDPVPEYINQKEPGTRRDDGGPFGGGGEDATIVNGGLSPDQVLWWPTAGITGLSSSQRVRFSSEDTIATSRNASTPRVWSVGLDNRSLRPFDLQAVLKETPENPVAGKITAWSDVVRGWALQTPSGSARDVRGKALFEVLGTKNFFTRAVELSREMNTGNGDDLVIEPGKAYSIVIGVFDNSGKRASGSTVIRLVFEPRTPPPGTFRRRC